MINGVNTIIKLLVVEIFKNSALTSDRTLIARPKKNIANFIRKFLGFLSLVKSNIVATTANVII